MTEVDFPRGGAKPTKELSTTLTTGKKRKASKDTDGPIDKKSFKEIEKGELEGLFKRPITVDLLTPGVRGLGAVQKIGNDSLLLKTISNINVIIPIKSVSKTYLETYKKTNYDLDDLFTIGQLLAFKIDNVKNKNRGHKEIYGTTCPSEVNDCINVSTLYNGLVINATVVSIEEKGAIFNMGIDSKVKGFAPIEALPSLNDLKVGQVMLMRVVRESNDLKRYIKLSAYPEMDTFDEPKMTANNLMPGTILHAEPENIVQNGVIVSFKNGMRAFINKEYLPPRLRIDMSKLVKTIRVVVVICNQNSPLLAFTAHPDIVGISKIQKRIISDDFEYGKVVDGIVYSVNKKCVNFVFQESSDKVALVTAKLLSNEMEDSDDIIKYEPGTVHKLRVLKYSPIDRIIYVTDKKDLLKIGNIAEEYKPGQIVTAKITDIVDAGLKVSFGLNKRGMILALHTLDTPSNLWKKAFNVNHKIKCRILYKNKKEQYVLTAKPSLVESTDEIINEYDQNLVDKKASGICVSINNDGAVIAFYNRVAGFLPKFQFDLIPDMQIGTVVTVKIVNVNEDESKMRLTIDSDSNIIKTQKKSKPEKPQKPKKPVKNLEIYNAKVLNKWPFGGTSNHTSILVELPGENVGRLHISELGPAKSKGIAEYLKKNKGKIITVRVIDVSKTTTLSNVVRKKLKQVGIDKFYEVSIDPAKLKEKKMKQKLLAYPVHFKVGSNVPVYMVATKSIKKRQKVELNPKFEAFLAKKRKEGEVYKENGERILAKIVKTRGRKVYVKPVKPKNEEESSDEEITSESEDENVSDVEDLSESELSNEEDDEMEIIGADDEGNEQAKEIREALTMLSGGNLWDSEALIPKIKDAKNEVNIEEKKLERQRIISETEEEAKEEMDNDNKEENNILHTETVLSNMEKTNELFNDADYNRLVLSNPNSAESWISYMAYQAQNGNIDEARRIAENALETIDSKEEDERLNVYTAYLNLEVTAGDEESLKSIFVRASAAHNPYEIHKRLADIFTNVKKDEELNKLYNVMIKKFGQIKHEVYVKYGTYLYQVDRKNDARELMKKALNSLPKKHHLEILSRFAHLEYIHGEIERGKTMFEKAIAAAPKRGDLWNIYIDKAIKFQSLEDTREIFERATISNLSYNTIKNLYQKWKDFEKLYGDEESLQEVNEKMEKFLIVKKKDDDEE